jgi:hypothetical protein
VEKYSGIPDIRVLAQIIVRCCVRSGLFGGERWFDPIVNEGVAFSQKGGRNAGFAVFGEEYSSQGAAAQQRAPAPHGPNTVIA